LARAKNTSRAEARRRSRATLRAEQEANEELEEPTEPQPAAQTRPSFFNPPRFREDLRLLPQILTSRRLLIVPPLMLILGFMLVMVSDQLVGDLVGIADLYVQLFFLPPALLTFFLAGFIAPRASYLVGALLGVFSGVLWAIIIFAGQAAAADPVTDPNADVLAVTGYLFMLNVAYGTFAAAFAAWYRDFLRRMQAQGQARRAEREAKERAKRREQRHEDRKTTRQRPSR
jgi:signal transduction histidine kinase